jgi:hypothetical protein
MVTATSVNVVHQARCPDIGPICQERAEPPQLHDQQFRLLELRAGLGVGITDRLGIELQLPLKLDKTSVEYRRVDGTAFTPDYPSIHHRDETLVGIGDPWLLGRVGWALGDVATLVRLGVSLPLGSTEPDPFALGEMGLPHQHVQLGTGTFDPILSLEASWRPGDAWLLRWTSQAQLALYENDDGYRAGRRYGMGLEGRRSLRSWLDLGLTADVVSESAERWHGEVKQEGNLGRTDVLVGMRALWKLGAYLLLADVKVPVWQHLQESGEEAGQLSYPVIVSLGVQGP